MHLREYQDRVLASSGDPTTAWTTGGIHLAGVSTLLTERMIRHMSGEEPLTAEWVEGQIGVIVRAAAQIASAVGVDLERAVDRSVRPPRGGPATLETPSRPAAARQALAHALA